MAEITEMEVTITTSTIPKILMETYIATIAAKINNKSARAGNLYL